MAHTRRAIGQTERRMSTDVSRSTGAGTPRPVPLRIPFLSTSFARNLWYYAMLWPVWWLLGIEQLLLPFFALYETGRFLVRADWRVRMNTAGLIALLLAIWWGVPVIWADREFLDLLLKDTATIWSQALILILIWNCVRTREDWWLLIRALTTMAIITVVAGLIYIAGIWRGDIVSMVGRVLPQAMVDASEFFTSIAYRQFGTISEEVGLVPFRVRAFSISYSSLSMACLLLMPLMLWRAQATRGRARLLFGGLVAGLFICFIFAESRISYLAFVAGAVFYVVLFLGLMRGHNRPFTIAIALLGLAAALLIGFFALRYVLQSLEIAFIDLRPSSWRVRLNLYIVTFQLLPEHPIAGWGAPVRIPDASTRYSAGTHSSYLSALFQHGIVGLSLYLALWVAIWRQVIAGLRNRANTRYRRLFWIAIATAFFMFNLREAADSWWWDQSLAFMVWLMWGLVLTAQGAVPFGKAGEQAQTSSAETFDSHEPDS